MQNEVNKVTPYSNVVDCIQQEVFMKERLTVKMLNFRIKISIYKGLEL